MDWSIAFSTIAGLGFAVGYLDYNFGVHYHKSTSPNAASWTIWTAIALVSSTTYWAASGDVWKSVIPIVNVVLCVATYIGALICGKFQKLKTSEWLALASGLAAVAVWAAYHSAVYANLVVQIAITIGCIPTWRAVWKNPKPERARPWLIWASAYSLAAVVVILRWKQWSDLAYPVLCALLHGSVPLLEPVRATIVRILRPAT